MKHLILVPTPIELELLNKVGTLPDDDINHIEVCGFGVAAAGANTSRLIEKHRPDKVVLAGIAGSYDSEHLIPGNAYQFSSVSMYGIGAGSGQEFKSPRDLGIAQFQSPSGENVFDTVLLENSSSQPLQLLTVASCANNESELHSRLTQFPNAAAEDMEGFAVATACVLAEVPLVIIRGISNAAGIRDKKFWQIEKAMRSVAELLQSQPDA